MHDNRFDDELKNRLGNYAEEPDDALWQGIAADISSTPVGLGWLRWISRGFLVSFAVVSILVNGSRFNVQGSRLENDVADSKFKVQDSKLNTDGSGLMARADSGFDTEASGQNVAGVECEDVNMNMDDSSILTAQRDGRGSVIEGQGSSAKKHDGVNGVDRYTQMAAGVSVVEPQRSKTEVKKQKVKAGGSNTEVNDSRVGVRRSSVDNDDASRLARQSRWEDNKLAIEARRSKQEEARAKFETRRSVAAGDRAKHEAKRSVQEENDARVDARRMKAMSEEQVMIVEIAATDQGSQAKAQAQNLKTDGSVDKERSMRDRETVAVRAGGRHKGDSTPAKGGMKTVRRGRSIAVSTVVSQRAETSALRNEAVLQQLSDDGMNAVFGPPMFMRNDTVPHGQQGTRRTVDAETVQVADSTREVNHVARRRAARAEILKKESEEKRDDRPRHVSLYFTAMPTLGYQRIEANPADNIIVESFQKVSNFSSRRLGIRAELGVEYRLAPRVSVFGGVLYYQRKQTINYVERVTTGVEHHTSGDTLTLDPQFSFEDKAFEYELKNIGMQVGVNYTLWKKKFLHVAGTGIELHKALNKLGDAQKLQGFSTNPSTYVFYNLYYRVQYPAEGRLKGIFQPTLNYSLFLNQDMNAPFYVKPYGLGLNLGLTYSF